MSMNQFFRLAAREYQIILEALAHKYGHGYSQEPEIGKLQAKLSVMAQAAHEVETREAAHDPTP